MARKSTSSNGKAHDAVAEYFGAALGEEPAKSKPAGRRKHPLEVCRPRGDRVVIRLDPKQEQTDGGILLPDTVLSGRQQLATVLAVGPKAGDDLKPGDRVIISGWAGMEVNADGPVPDPAAVEFLLLREEDVTAVLPKDY